MQDKFIDFKQFFQSTDNINECVVAAVKLPDGIFLAKNRDRGYKAKVKIVHEILHGTEIVFWHDLDTDWSEGMNEFGIGIVNSSLLVIKDEKEGKIDQKVTDDGKVKKKKMTHDGLRIRKALTYHTIDEAISCLKGQFNGGKPLSGQTIISDGNKTFVLEITSRFDPIVKQIDDDQKVVVRTNHGVYNHKAGYTVGRKKESSHTRMNVAQEELEKVQNGSEILDVLKGKHQNDPFLNPYRVRNPYNMQTTGQILMDLERKTILCRMDRKEGSFEGIQNKLPTHYIPKINIVVTG